MKKFTDLERLIQLTLDEHEAAKAAHVRLGDFASFVRKATHLEVEVRLNAILENIPEDATEADIKEMLGYQVQHSLNEVIKSFDRDFNPYSLTDQVHYQANLRLVALGKHWLPADFRHKLSNLNATLYEQEDAPASA